MRFLAISVAFLAMTGCLRKPAADSADLFSVDKAFSQMSVEQGLNAAFIHYAADSVVKLREGQFPITGKAEMSKLYRERPDSGLVLKWRPVKAEIAASGEIGYTYGEWELYVKSKDTTLYGNYVSIWKKQTDGAWKYILDTGNNTPKPSSENLAP